MSKTNTTKKSKKPKKIIGDANFYDKIIKENLDAVLPMLLEKLVGLKLQSVEIVRPDMQSTKEVVADSLKIATDTDGIRFILHDEFQLKDETDMVYRMNEYSAIAMRKFKLPVRQYVFFISDKPPKMVTEIHTPDLSFRFNLFVVNSVSYKNIRKRTNRKILFFPFSEISTATLPMLWHKILFSGFMKYHRRMRSEINFFNSCKYFATA